jgi:hypothetical protein
MHVRSNWAGTIDRLTTNASLSDSGKCDYQVRNVGPLAKRENSARECPLLMLWTAPAPRHRSAIDWLR